MNAFMHAHQTNCHFVDLSFTTHTERNALYRLVIGTVLAISTATAIMIGHMKNTHQVILKQMD